MATSIDTSAYCKMVLHAAKYPHLAVRGFLLGSQAKPTTSGEGEGNGVVEEKQVHIVDVVPATHNALVTPVLETLLIHLDLHCQESKQRVVGVYFCNQRLDDTVFDDLWARIALEKLRAPVVLQVENLKMGLNANSPCVRAFAHDSGKWRPKKLVVENEEDTLSTTSLAIQNKLYRELSDFEGHLDDPLTNDFYNIDLTAKIHSFI